MRGFVGQLQMPQKDRVSKRALHRMRRVYYTCRNFLFWPFFTALLLVVGVSPLPVVHV
jgi:hypothetical protein